MQQKAVSKAQLMLAKARAFAVDIASSLVDTGRGLHARWIFWDEASTTKNGANDKLEPDRVEAKGGATSEGAYEAIVRETGMGDCAAWFSHGDSRSSSRSQVQIVPKHSISSHLIFLAQKLIPSIRPSTPQRNDTATI